MKTIYKLDFGIQDGDQFKQVPQGAKVVHCAMQHGRLCAWFECDTDNEDTECRFRVHGTGHMIDHELPYLGTAITDDGYLVWHLFGEMQRVD